MRAWAALALSVVIGCGSDGGSSDKGAPAGTDSGVPERDTGSPAPLCVDAPVVTWSSWGAGFVSQNCQSCHRSTSTDRHGAPESAVFDTEADALSAADQILARVAGPEPTMPPSGGVSEDDRYLLEVWLTCWK